jgi:outer membrane protein OmpA-like peptidoglycan-associated protein
MLNLIAAALLPFGLTDAAGVEQKGAVTTTAAVAADVAPIAGVDVADQEQLGVSYGIGWHVALTGSVTSLARINDGSGGAGSGLPASPPPGIVGPGCLPPIGTSARLASQPADFGSERAYESRIGATFAPWGGPVALAVSVAPETGATDLGVSARLPLGKRLALRATGGFSSRPRVASGDSVIDDALAWGGGAELALSPHSAAILGMHGERGLEGAGSPTSWAAGMELHGGAFTFTVLGGGGVINQDAPDWSLMSYASIRFGGTSEAPRRFITAADVSLGNGATGAEVATTAPVVTTNLDGIEPTQLPPEPVPLSDKMPSDGFDQDPDAHPFDPALLTATGDAIELGQPVLFELNQPRIRRRFRAPLDQLATHLGDHTELTLVEIDGYCDSTGSDAWNDHLSLARATSVVDYLVSRGISRDRLVPAGHGENDPIAPNDSPAHRAHNRRVVVRVLSAD